MGNNCEHPLPPSLCVCGGFHLVVNYLLSSCQTDQKLGELVQNRNMSTVDGRMCDKVDKFSFNTFQKLTHHQGAQYS